MRDGSWRWSTSWIAWCAISRVCKSGRLVIGASSTVGEQFLPAHLGRFHVAYPHVALEVRIGNTGEITAAVVTRELDFAFVGSPPETDELIAEPVFTDDVVAFVAPGDPLLRDAPLDPAALSGRQFVLRERGSATRDLALRCLAAAGCEPAHVIELGSNEAVKRAVEAGLGIGLLSTHAIEAERLAGSWWISRSQGWECGRSFWLIRRRDRVLTRAEQAFLGAHAAAGDGAVTPCCPIPANCPPGCRCRRAGGRRSTNRDICADSNHGWRKESDAHTDSGATRRRAGSASIFAPDDRHRGQPRRVPDEGPEGPSRSVESGSGTPRRGPSLRTATGFRTLEASLACGASCRSA